MMIISESWEGSKAIETSREKIWMPIVSSLAVSFSRGPMPWQVGPSKALGGGLEVDQMV